ncbi:divergent polysaccharide deacetylase family protein [Acidiphilium acidophilum]|uniref:divergent polysaccharide deacetylase family protein n=1 Tax=Acidiphilium acidophilum TaxID=76588 RepID=UPI002E8E77AE|nr:divergent polysaccharide deacetylase family protein [Acidiphilium acidophilum]
MDRVTTPVPRALKLFWGGFGLVVIAGAAYLQYLGPIKPPATLPARQADGAIPAPSPMLLAASAVDPAWKIPHPGPYGITPMRYYAARPATATAAGKPEIAILVAGLGYALAPGLAAVKTLPPAVSLGLSPYGVHDAALALAARKAGHETILGLPMQVNDAPDITEGDQALHAGASSATNLKRLDWALSRIQGYAGVTDAIGVTVPETFMTHPHAASWLAGQISASGLFLIAASPGAALPSGVTGQSATIVIDPATGTSAIVNDLNLLVSTAIAKGSAIGVITEPTRAGIATLAAWLRSPSTSHVSLVPVSTLAEASAAGSP